MADPLIVGAAEQKRLFISGIANSLSENELVARLKNYGTIVETLVLNRKNIDIGSVFGHCTINLDQAQWSRLRKLSGTILKGSKLRIEEAQQNWLSKKVEDERRPPPKAPNKRKRPPIDTIPAVESKRVKRGEVVKDSSITQKSRKQGWIKGRYGRAIAILKTENGVKLKHNPDALSKLWGSAPSRPDQLPYSYDDEEEEWHDRRGCIMRDVEIVKKRNPVETHAGGRVEIWNSEDEEDDVKQAATTNDDQYTVASSARPDYEPTENGTSTNIINQEELDEQLTKERSLGMSLLGDMFKDTEAAEMAENARKEKRKLRDKLDIVTRFDPNAPEAESDTESEPDPAVQTGAPTFSSDTRPGNVPSGESDHTMSDAESEDDGPDTVPSFLQPRPEVSFKEDLTAIFKPRTGADEVKFSLFGDHELSDAEEEDEEPVMVAVADPQDTQNIHPDRLNRPDTADVFMDDDTEENANYTALAKDRGFNTSVLPINNGVFPLLLSTGPNSFWATQRGFFGDKLEIDVIRKNWEEGRAEVTRDWKRKRREGTKKSRKASARQGR